MKTQVKTPKGVKPPQLSFEEWWKRFDLGREKMKKGKWRDDAPYNTDNK